MDYQPHGRIYYDYYDDYDSSIILIYIVRVRHLNNIDETWVPSKWQKEMFVSSGAIPEKIEVIISIVISFINFDVDYA